jgi:hypothetical protein
VLNVQTFKQVIYRDIYPNIDLQFIVEYNKPKYNFILHPNADASLIKWHYKGANKVKIENQKIVINTINGNLEEQIPFSYIVENGKEVKVNYVLLADNSFSFIIKNEYLNKTLVIDPIPWATYFGGSNGDEGVDIATDFSNNTYTIGHTNSSNNIATSGSHLSVIAGDLDVFILKLNASGNRIWSTYYGGSLQETAAGVACDSLGNVFITGYTKSSSGIASVGSHQTVFGGVGDGFIAKFNSAGIRQWSTYYGGLYDDDGSDIAVDGNGNVIIVGTAGSNNNIGTSGSHISFKLGFMFAGFIAKFNTLGTRLWGTYYYGNFQDGIVNVCCDINNNIIFTGRTWSSSGVATTGAFRSTKLGNSDVFIGKMNSSGVRQWATYYNMI